MSKVEQIEEQIKDLNPDELRSFRNWFVQFDAEIWDQQIKDDAKSGKLGSIAERALRDHETGRSTIL
jgi:uncharacterized protein YfaT (DUF1175 family)